MLATAAAAAVPVPRDTPYSVARRLLMSLGYAPVAPARARCVFLWAKDGATFEIQTRGLDDLVVDRIRCRAGCQ